MGKAWGTGMGGEKWTGRIFILGVLSAARGRPEHPKVKQKRSRKERPPSEGNEGLIELGKKALLSDHGFAARRALLREKKKPTEEGGKKKFA